MAAPRPLLSQEQLKELFDYDPVTGLLIWRRRDNIDPGFNGRFAGKKAGALCGRGWKVMVDHRSLVYHRVIWKWTYGTEPPEIDHVNGDSSDNRLVNLRASTRVLNAKNRAPNKGKSLPKGVTLGKGRSNYEARIVSNGVRETLGYFATAEDAHQAYLEAAEARFGEWARAGEARREFSRAKKPRTPLSAESRAKISTTLTGRKLPPFTEAHRAALSAAGKKRPSFSPEWRKAISAAKQGKKRGHYRSREANITPGAH